MWKRISSLYKWMSHSFHTHEHTSTQSNDAHCSVVNRNAISMCIGFNVCAHGFAVHLFIHNAPAWILYFGATLYKCVYSFINRHLWHSTTHPYPYHTLNSVNFSWPFVFVHFRCSLRLLCQCLQLHFFCPLALCSFFGLFQHRTEKKDEQKMSSLSFSHGSLMKEHIEWALSNEQNEQQKCVHRTDSMNNIFGASFF